MPKVRVHAPKGVFVKIQTKFARWPAMIESHRHDDFIVIEVTPSWPAALDKPPASEIVMSAHEAQAFAAWLSEQAEHLLAKANRKAIRDAARAAKKHAE